MQKEMQKGMRASPRKKKLNEKRTENTYASGVPVKKKSSQAVGRVDRIGQTKETRIFFPVYDSPGQTKLHELLMLKVAVSMSTDGLDPDGALAASGAGETSDYAGLSVGKALYDMLKERV